VQERASQDGVLDQVPEAVVYDLAAAERELAGFEPEQPDYSPPASWWQRFSGGLARMLGRGGQETLTQAEAADDDAITIIDGEQLRRLERGSEDEVTVIMPSINRRRALATARHLAHRAGMPVRIVVVLDRKRRGFVDTLNRTARRIQARFLVYLAEDAVAGEDWLKTAHARLEDSGKGLLAFNCGKWHGRIAAFGMVRSDWVRELYGGQILYSGYRAHRADNELTAIARATDQFVYCPEAVLLENDPGKLVLDQGVEQSHAADRRLFRQRYGKAFGGLAAPDRLAALESEYIAADRSRLQSGSRQEKTEETGP
jgi:hypothetical protein